MASKGFTIWFTGLSGSGKSTLSGMLAERLRELGRQVEILDGDEVRENLNQGLGFSKEDRDTNIKRISYVCKLLSRNGVVVIAAAISPYAEARQKAREEITDFVEVFTCCPIEECIRRDVKGLYQKALSGEIKHFTGVSDPYEAPESPEVIVETHKEDPGESTEKILSYLVERQLLETDRMSGMLDG